MNLPYETNQTIIDDAFTQFLFDIDCKLNFPSALNSVTRRFNVNPETISKMYEESGAYNKYDSV